MSSVLFVHIRYPEFDRCSGDVRVTNMLAILAQRHEVSLHVLHQPPGYLEAPENRAYADALAAKGVRVTSGSLTGILGARQYDAIVVEFWYVARPLLRQLRALQPRARLFVDTEHVYFYSDEVRAAALGTALGDDARERKQAELETYRQADAILTTTDEDRDVVLAEALEVVCRTVPNIHALPDAAVGDALGRKKNSVVFVGNFRHNPSNVDSMVWFCGEVMPRLRRRVPDATLSIVGNMPPAEVLGLANDHIEVTGYVPQTAPYLDKSMVSVCPLRFGAGLKGKIGEAMSHGVPVVSTSVGTQGMQPRIGDEILVADDPDGFAESIAQLLADGELWARMSHAGRAFIERNFGFAAVESRLAAVFDDLSWLEPKRMVLPARLVTASRLVTEEMLDKHVRWRLRR